MSVISELTSKNIFHFFGNLTAVSVNEVLVYPRTYVEPASQAQRSIVSSSANDDDPNGSGAKEVRITYLDSNYVLKTEDILLNGTAAVNTVANDIRFIESMKVIKGTYAAGAIRLMTLINGGGTEIMGIVAGATDSMAAHHYVPAGKTAWPICWRGSADKTCNFKLLSQDRTNGNLVDYVTDLQRLLSTGESMDFMNHFNGGIVFSEKTYIRITCVPGQNTSTIIRAAIDLVEG